MFTDNARQNDEYGIELFCVAYANINEYRSANTEWKLYAGGTMVIKVISRYDATATVL